MVKEILPNIYRIEIPLPNNPLKALNSYLIKGAGHFLIVDTGMNRKECQDAMLTGLTKLNVDLNKTDFFITHLHADHLGLVATLAMDNSKVYFNEAEAAMVNSEKLWQERRTIYLQHGFPSDELARAFDNHPAKQYGLRSHVDFCLVREGDTIDIGDYSFSCVATPGHSPGHTCLYEANRKIMISGDHILLDITPNISIWPQMKNSLKTYLASLDKVNSLDVSIVLPGHRRLLNNHKQRIVELKEHHQNRLREVISALKLGDKTAFEIAPHLSWDVNYGSWELFPPSQKWFAFGETLAHIEYLEETKAVRRKARGQQIVFSLP